MADYDLGNPTDLAIIQNALALYTKLDTTHQGTGGTTHLLATTSLAGFISAADKTKLDSIEADSNNYSHPTGDGNLHVPATSTTNENKWLKAGATAGAISWEFVTKADVGLGNADNTSDANKPISTAQQNALDTLTTAVGTKLDATHQGTGGNTHAAVTTTVAGFMSAADKVKLNGIATSANNYSHPTGDGNLHVPATGTTNNNSVLKAGPTAGSVSWQPVTKADVGLGNVDNTSDANKPISIAQQDALDDKLPTSHAGTGGTAHAAVTTTDAGFMSAADKVKLNGIATSANNYAHPTGDGNLHVPATSTTNNAKFLKAGATAGSIAWSLVTKADVGLANVDNTSDANKPVSTAQSTAINNRLSKIASDTMSGTLTATSFIAAGAVFAARGGGASQEGGQIVLGFGNNQASAINGQDDFTWNMDVGGGSNQNMLRFFSVDGTGTAVMSWQANGVNGDVEFLKNVISRGNLDISSAAPIVSLIETDNASNYYAWQVESGTLRLRYNSTVIWTVAVNGDLTTTGKLNSGDIAIQKANPEFSFWDTGAALNRKRSRIITSGGITYIQTLNDSGTLLNTPIQFAHATGAATLAVRPSWNGYQPWDNNNLPSPVSEAPQDNSTYARKNAVWVKSVGGAVTSDTPPATPEAGQKWINTTNMREYVWYVDTDGGQWVQTSAEGLSDAPYDGKSYVRNNGIWTLADREVLVDADLSSVGPTYPFILPGGFKRYHIEIMHLDFVTADQIGLQIRVAGSYVTTNYHFGTMTTTASSGQPVLVYNTSAGPQASMAITTDNLIVGSSKLNMDIVFNTRNDVFNWTGTWGRSVYVGSGYSGSSAVDGFRLIGRAGFSINTLKIKIIGER